MKETGLLPTRPSQAGQEKLQGQGDHPGRGTKEGLAFLRDTCVLTPSGPEKQVIMA